MLKAAIIFLTLIRLAMASPAPALDGAVEFDAMVKLEGFNAEEELKVKQAIELIKKVIVSEIFRERVLKHSYLGKNEFKNNEGLTNAEIYQKIMEGSEKLNPGANRRMDLHLELYHDKTRTIGYTYPNVSKIWINRKYFDRYTPVQVADNLMHEWMHKLGFDHEVKWNEDRKHSVPYAIGYLVEELALAHFQGNLR